MLIKFDKMQALGNDFVMIDESQNHFPSTTELSKNFFINISDRHYGIGCDQVVLYKTDNENNKIFAKFFNPDGSEAEICGNAARCMGVLIKKKEKLSKCILVASKKAYPIQIDKEICVEMGKPSFNPKDIGLVEDVENYEEELNQLHLSKYGIYKFSCISVGNPHLVLFCKNILDENAMMSLGSTLENHRTFKNKINVSFVYIESKNEIVLTVFERGAKLTQACGSGACASAAVYCANFLADESCESRKSKEIFVKQKGGTLLISIDNEGNIFQTGSALYVFSGEIEI
jgi:diaminopimelate epimerase